MGQNGNGGPSAFLNPARQFFWGAVCCASPALGGEPSPASLCAHVPLPHHPRQRWHPDRIDTAPPASLLLPSLGRGCCAWAGAAPGCPHLTQLCLRPLSPHRPPRRFVFCWWPRHHATKAAHLHVPLLFLPCTADPSRGAGQRFTPLPTSTLPNAQLPAQHLPFSPKPLIFGTHPYGAGEGKLPSGAFLGRNQEPAVLEIPSGVSQGRAVRWWHRLLQPVPGAVPQPRRMGSAASRPARCRRLELLICSSGAAAWPRASSPLHGRSGFRSHPACHPARGFLLPESTSRCPRMAPAQHGLP